MTLFQVVLIAFCGIQLLLALARFARSKQITGLAFACLWGIAIALVVDPNASTRLANAVGIGRGVDLVIYALLTLFLWAHYEHYLRYKRVEHHITQLVRELALRGARPAPGVPESPSPDQHVALPSERGSS